MKRDYQKSSIDSVNRGELSQEDLFFIPPEIARKAIVHFEKVNPGEFIDTQDD